MIIIDIHEPQEVFDAFDIAGIHFETASLIVGDFTNDKGTFIAERKGFNDFWASMIDRRIYEQTAEMYAQYKANRYVFVEVGSLAELSIDHNENINWIYSLFGVIENWECKFREYIDLEDLARKLDALDKQLGKEKKLREKRLKLSKLTVAERMLAEAPSIGSGLAKLIMKECGNFVTMLMDLYGEQELLDCVKGIRKNGKRLIDLKAELERIHG